MIWRDRLPASVHRSGLWTFGREVRVSGLRFALRRRRIWRKILRTAAIHTQYVNAGATVETHLM
jgi:hypothetical protein